MFILISIVHVILCIALILIVLLQTGKGSDLASAFGGGGSQAMFGGRGPASFLNKMTTIAAVLFMVTSITLAYLSAGRSDSLLSGIKEPETKEEQTTVPENAGAEREEKATGSQQNTSSDTVEAKKENVADVQKKSDSAPKSETKVSAEKNVDKKSQ